MGKRRADIVKLSDHFTLAEATLSQTATRIGIDNTPDEGTIHNMRLASAGMEQVRYFLGHSINVNSWFRCLRLNRAIGSKDSSAHVQGWAIDFTCPAFGTPLEICKEIIASGIEFDQLIYEGTWVHISFHPAMRGQVLTAEFNNGITRYKKGLP